MAQLYNNIDLSSCDDEQIHLLGKVQSNGNLLAFDKQNFKLSYISDNSDVLFGIKKKAIHISVLFEDEFCQFVYTLIKKPFTNELYPTRVKIEDKYYRCFISDAISEVIIELELEIPDLNDFSLFKRFDNLVANIRNIDALDVLYGTVVHEMKVWFGFDRIMMYKFDELGDGEVVAESKKLGLESFIGLKYPSTDIPKQARRLYLSNLSRAINLIDDEGVPIICLKENKSEIDLSYSVYRSVSPVHILYLKNMGVTATHAISLVIDNKLWGLIIFHHYNKPRFLNFNQRQIAQTLAINTSLAIELLQSKKHLDTIKKEKNILDKIKYSDTTYSTLNIIIDNWNEIVNQLDVCGFSMVENNNVVNSYEESPADTDVNALYQYLTVNNESNINQTDEIKNKIKIWQNEEISGFVSFTISKVNAIMLFFWRKSKEQITNWAGNPEKSMEVVEINNRKVLTPRSSFALWQEKVKGKSFPWTSENLSFISLLSEAIVIKEIEKYKALISKNHELKENQESLKHLLTQKSEELYMLNLKLQDELSDNKKYQRELEIAKAASEQLYNLKSHFISNISHEVRTPINAIIGLAQLLISENNDKEEIVELSQMILTSANRLIETTNRILKVSKIENNQNQLVIEDVNIVECIQGLLEPLKILANKKEQTIIFNVHNKAIRSITDKHYFSQIITNLVSNAIKYTFNKGVIEINLKKINKEGSNLIFVSVEDNGIGIDEKLIDKIFDPFFTEVETAKQSDDSTGLGLYLVKNYLSYLNGEIQVTSTKNKGSLFTISIPINM